MLCGDMTNFSGVECSVSTAMDVDGDPSIHSLERNGRMETLFLRNPASHFHCLNHQHHRLHHWNRHQHQRHRLHEQHQLPTASPALSAFPASPGSYVTASPASPALPIFYIPTSPAIPALCIPTSPTSQHQQRIHPNIPSITGIRCVLNQAQLKCLSSASIQCFMRHDEITR